MEKGFCSPYTQDSQCKHGCHHSGRQAGSFICPLLALNQGLFQWKKMAGKATANNNNSNKIVRLFFISGIRFSIVMIQSAPD